MEPSNRLLEDRRVKPTEAEVGWLAPAQTTVLLMTVLCLGTRSAPLPRLYMLF